MEILTPTPCNEGVKAPESTDSTVTSESTDSTVTSESTDLCDVSALDIKGL